MVKHIQTTRLRLIPLSYKQVQFYTQLRFKLERALKLRPIERSISTDEYELIEGLILPQLLDPEQPVYFTTLWAIVDDTHQALVGSACFKGAPNSLGQVEVGYGVYPKFQNQGFMTEALEGLVHWAAEQRTVAQVVAETARQNLASQAVLRKVGFEMTEQTTHTNWWAKTVRP